MPRLTSNSWALITASSIFVSPDAPRAKRIKPDGTTAELPTFYPDSWPTPEDGRELYVIKGFHLMHCLVCPDPSPKIIALSSAD